MVRFADYLGVLPLVNKYGILLYIYKTWEIGIPSADLLYGNRIVTTRISHMPFPSSEREVYQRNPLQEVICQLRFPTILQVTVEKPAQFQNAIRDRYPLYAEENATGLPKEVVDILAGLPVPKVVQQPVYKFLTKDETRFIALSQDSIAVSEKEYQRWEHFREEIKSAASAFQTIYNPAFYTRIGLRYQDVLDRDELGLHDRQWAELLNPSFIGELGDPALIDEVDDIRTISLVRLPEVHKGFVRIVHGLAKTDDTKKQVYVIDIDFYTEERSELGDAFQILNIFNRWGGKLFRWAISQTLRDALGPTRIQ